MIIYIKIGTMPTMHMHLCRKHKPPKIGDWVQVKKENSPHVKPEGVLIDGIEVVAGGATLYIAERM